MSPNRLAAVVVSIALLSGLSLAQVNQVSGTIGRTFVSTQTIQGSNSPFPNINFGDGISFSINYSRLLKEGSFYGIFGEVPLAIAPDTDLNTGENVVPASYKAFFITPGIKFNFFPSAGLSPWVSVGGGYGLFKMAGHENYFGPNPGSTRTNTGVLEFGAGVDVWPFQRWGFRLEARDFYSGAPDLGVNTGRSRQHNYYVGGGAIFRF
jgi:hypothetical protein